MSRSVYVYRLDVAYPPRSHWSLPDYDPNWEPEEWEPNYRTDPTTGALDSDPFRWPPRSHYLSRSAAMRRADLLRGWGATVEVVRSEPVQWRRAVPDGSGEQ